MVIQKSDSLAVGSNEFYRYLATEMQDRPRAVIRFGLVSQTPKRFKNISNASETGDFFEIKKEGRYLNQRKPLNTQQDRSRNKQSDSPSPANTATCEEGFIPEVNSNDFTSFPSSPNKTLTPVGFKFNFTAKEQARKQIEYESALNSLGVAIIA